MRFNDDGQTDSNIDEAFYGANQETFDTAKLFTSWMDREWEHLAPENARPLARVKEIFRDHLGANRVVDSYATDEWVEAARMVLLPFHGFASDHWLVVRFKRRLESGVSLNVNWLISYMHLQAGSAGLYAADLFLIKRKIYEQGAVPKNSLEIKLEAELAPFVEKYREVEIFQRLFELNMTIACELNVDDKGANKSDDKNAARRKRSFVNVCTKRFASIVKRSRRTVDGNRQTVMMRVELDEYWLEWAKVAHRAEFDFDYLASLEPIEMRFYELVQLLRFQDGDRALCVIRKAPLRISYSEFASLMPLPPVETYEQIENQINELCRAHLDSGFLETITIKSIERNEQSADADLEMVFGNETA